MKNVFGYPEFDAEGEEILCTYDNAYSDMLMDIRVYRMEPGRKRGFCRRGEETAVLLLSGTVTFGWEGRTETVSRRDVFTDGPYALHACAGEEITVEAQTDAEILVQCTKNDTGVLRQAVPAGGRPLGLLLRGQVRQCGQAPGKHHL